MSEARATSSGERLIALGSIVGTHGVGGLLRFHSRSDVAAALAAVSTIHLAAPGTEPLPWKVVSAKPHGHFVLLRLEGIDGIDRAATLVGAVVSVPAAALPVAGPGEFYAYQLEGLEVLTVAGGRLGSVESVFPTGSNDVLVVRDGARELLIPVIADVIRTVDLDARRVVIEPIAGLLD
jgi:16S rRNA processing protein RimM